jgi:predicted TIM-barrel fold metal-dependent hydrolase
MKGVAMISLHDVTEAIKEAQRTVTELGFVGVFARPEPLRSLPWHSKYYDTLWSALEELGVPLGFHSAAASGELPQVGDRFGDDFLLRHICGHPMENMLAMVDIICGGVLERHPNLKVAFLECYSGWVSFWLNRMDGAVEKSRKAPITKMKPSEYFKRQCWIATEAERELAMTTLPRLRRKSYGTTVPGYMKFGIISHVNVSREVYTISVFVELKDVSDSAKKKVLNDNPKALYTLS